MNRLTPLAATLLLTLVLARPVAAAPSSALVMPFDASAGSVSFLVASHPRNAADPAGVRTHWAFWDEDCTHLLDAIVCLPADGSVVVDPTSITGSETNTDLGGRRGFVTVTAYEAGAACDPTDHTRGTLAPDALIGSFTLASVASGVSFGGSAIALPADASATFVDLPGDTPDGDGYQAALRLQSFAPARLDVSRVILLALREHAGNGAFRATELGPASTGTAPVHSAVRYADKDGASTSLSDSSFACSAFSSLRRDDPSTLLPPGVGDGITSGGFVAFENPRRGEEPLGGTTWLFGFHAQAVGSFGVLATGDSMLASRAQPTPAATPSPGATTPTARPSATATPGPTATPTRTPSGSVTPRPTGSLIAPTGSPAPTPTGSAGATPSPSPSGGPIATATSGATPAATRTPAPTSSPSATTTAAATPGITPTPPRTPSPTPSPTPPAATPRGTATPAACTTLTVEVRTAYGSSAPDDVSGVITTLAYPASVALPGTGNEPSVTGRVSNVSGVSGLFQATDNESALRIGLISVSSAIPQGAFVRVVFDCVTGARPAPGAFGCLLEASTLDGDLVPGAACSTEILP